MVDPPPPLIPSASPPQTAPSARVTMKDEARWAATRTPADAVVDLGLHRDDGDEADQAGEREVELASGEDDRQADAEDQHRRREVEDRLDIDPGREDVWLQHREQREHRREHAQGEPFEDHLGAPRREHRSYL
jgi:hypothetical protein